jgi:hypothetical protein
METIGARCGKHQGVSGAGGSCLYRAIAYQLCQDAGLAYDDEREVRVLRRRVQSYLVEHAKDNPLGVRWCEIGGYIPGYAEAPVPQVMAYVIHRPVSIWLDSRVSIILFIILETTYRPRPFG